MPYPFQCQPNLVGLILWRQAVFIARNNRGKIIRGLEAIAAKNPSYSNGAMPDIGEIGLACVLDYLDFRKQVNWRDHAPNLASWLADFATVVPGYEDSMPPMD